ncbi:MAG: hypothetical protein CBC22_06580 [Alphaproteobacteria bacterium TMED62]|nr:MAG: hypothetical protein CBC22_06580 [Alphaproteobacteria bacterium TMED62]|tara:strand:+ start:1634 stop:2029 length:396 start_codon:yes stop_codon:yes gene_type:complete
MSKEVVAAIIFCEDKVLVTQRKFNENKDFSYKFEFPGGKVEKGEKKIIALKRELREELNLELKYFKHFESYKYKYSNTEIILHFYLSKVKDLRLSLKVHECYKLLKISQLSNLDWLDADYKVIKKLEKVYL